MSLERHVGALIRAMLFERICPACGQPTNEPSCLLCGNETQERAGVTDAQKFNSSGVYSPVDPDQDFSDENPETVSTEVHYLTPDDVKLKLLPRLAVPALKYLNLYGIPLMCVWLAVVGHFRILFILGAVLAVQRTFIRVRAKHLTGPLLVDEELQSRVSPPLLELCAMAGVTAPRVRIQQSVNLIGMTIYKKEPLLFVSPDFLNGVDDRGLRAVIAHEVVHLKKDMAVIQKRSQLIFLVIYLAFIASLWAANSGRPLVLALYVAFLFPAFTLINWATDFSWQVRETRADLEGNALAKDPEADIRAFLWATEETEQRRRSILGPPAFRWLLFPYSLRPTTHPSTEDRVAAIRAMPLDESNFEIDIRTNRRPMRALPLVVAAAVVVGLIFFLRQPTSHSPSQSVSPHVESRGGAHFIPIDDLGIPAQEGGLPTRWHFYPLTHEQVHLVSTTANQALAVASAKNGLSGPLITWKIAEGSFAGMSLLGYGTDPSASAADGIPSYLVVFQGPYIVDPQSGSAANLCVVVVNATEDTIVESVYFTTNAN